MRNFWLKALLVLGCLAGLLQAATVSGIVTDSVSGSKVDSVRVRLMSGNTTVATDTTNAEGAYSFATVDTGRYTIRASKTNYVTKSVNDTVSTGETEVTVNIAIVAIVRTTVSGTVTDSVAATALKGVVVQLQTTGGQPLIDTTGDDGKYSFADVQSGTLTVRASLTGFVTKSLSVTATTSAGVTADIALVKPVLTTVSGTVTDSAAGTPVANAVVRLRQGATTVSRDTTGADGTFSFADVATGTYTLQATLDGFTAKTIDATVTSTAFTATIALAKPVVASVAGTVTDSAAGTALAGAVVRLQSGAGGGAGSLDTTGSDGKFSFANVVVGDYTVRAALADYTTKSVAAAVTSAAAVTADVALVKVVTSSVSGSVTDSTAGTKIAGAVVQLRTGSGGGAAVVTDTTDAEGAYSFPKVAVGSYSVRVSVTGYVTKTVSAAVATSEAVTANVPLVPITYGTIVGKVTADSLGGAALSGVMVIMSRTGAAVDTATTDAEGKYSFDKVQTQTAFTLRGSKTGYTPKTANLAVKREGADTVNFFMALIVTKDIKVIVLKAADSSAIAGASVALTVGGEVLIATTDAAGNAIVKAVVEGTYTVAASAAGFTPATRQLQVNAASADSVRVYLTASTAGTKTLIGTVADSTTGTKLAGVTVTARVSGGGGITLAAITGTDGAYIIVGLPVTAATVTLSASFDNYRTASRSVTLGTANAADTTKADVKLLSSGLPVVERKPMAVVNGGKPFVDVNAFGSITLYNFDGSGMVEMFSLSGKLLHRRVFAGAGIAGVALPPVQHSNTAYILKVTQSTGVVVSSRVVRCRK